MDLNDDAEGREMLLDLENKMRTGEDSGGKRNPNRHRIYRFNHIHMQILEFYHKDQKSPESIQRFEINTSLLGLSIPSEEVQQYDGLWFHLQQCKHNRFILCIDPP